MELPVSPAAKYTQNTTSTPESREKCKLLLGCHTHQGRSLTSVWKRGPVPFSSCLALILSILQELGVREWSLLTSCHCPLDISLLWDTGVENEIYQTGLFNLTPRNTVYLPVRFCGLLWAASNFYYPMTIINGSFCFLNYCYMFGTS